LAGIVLAIDQDAGRPAVRAKGDFHGSHGPDHRAKLMNREAARAWGDTCPEPHDDRKLANVWSNLRCALFSP